MSKFLGASNRVNALSVSVASNANVGAVTHSLTANRTFTLPDKDGTFAMISDVGGAGNTSYAATIGDGTSTTITVTHNLSVTDVNVSIFELGGNKRKIDAGVEIRSISSSQVSLVFATAPASNSLRVIVISGGGSAAGHIRTSMTYYYGSTLLVTEKQPVMRTKTAGNIIDIKYYRDNTTYPTGAGSILIKKNGTTIYTVTIGTGDAHQTWITTSTTPTAFALGDTITATVSSAGTTISDITVDMTVEYVLV